MPTPDNYTFVPPDSQSREEEPFEIALLKGLIARVNILETSQQKESQALNQYDSYLQAVVCGLETLTRIMLDKKLTTEEELDSIRDQVEREMTTAYEAAANGDQRTGQKTSNTTRGKKPSRKKSK